MGLSFLKCRCIVAATMILCIILFPVVSIAEDSPAHKPHPAILLTGTLIDIPRTVAFCAPLNIQYSVKNTGAVPVSSGQLNIEIRTTDTGRLVFTRQLPFTLEPGSGMIESVDFAPGAYTLILKASAYNLEHRIAREYKLAEQELTVSGPIVVKKSSGSMVRVLVWLNRTSTAVQRAFAEKILTQAFEDESLYYRTVDSAEDFRNQVMSGAFNTAVLFEPDELLDQSDWLMERVKRGQGLVIIGSENRTRMIAETFGFKFSDTLTSDDTILQFTEDSGMELSGTVPVRGRILLPKKENAKTAAMVSGDNRPAILIDTAGKGRVIVMPFSFTRSALDTGSTSLYSLLLRAAVLTVAPENDEQTSLSPIELLVSALSGPVRARIVETLPPGTQVIWKSPGGIVKNQTILYDLIADTEPQRLQYLCQPPAGNKTPSVTEVLFECNDKLVSQGKIE